MNISKNAIAATLMLLATSFTAQAQQGCVPRSEALANLSINYNEHPLLVGNSEIDTDIVEVFSAANGSTFTVIVTRRVGDILCTRMIAAGKNLRPMPFTIGRGS